MEIRILLDITDKFEKALRRIAFAVVAGAGATIAKDETAQNQYVTAEDAPSGENVQTNESAPKAEQKTRAKTKKQTEPAVEISTPAAVAEGGKESEASAEVEATPTIVHTSAPAKASTTEPEPTPAQEENEDELGKGAVGDFISELTNRLINRVNEEGRDKATINKNLRAKCEELQVRFPTVPALIQAIGYGNAYKACVGEG